MQSIQTERPVIVAEQVIEIDIIVCLGHALCYLEFTKLKFSAQNTWFLLSIRTTFVSLPPNTVVSVPLNKVVLDYGRAEIANCIGKLAEALQKMLARLQEKRYVERDDKGGWRVFIIQCN